MSVQPSSNPPEQQVEPAAVPFCPAVLVEDCKNKEEQITKLLARVRQLTNQVQRLKSSRSQLESRNEDAKKSLESLMKTMFPNVRKDYKRKKAFMEHLTCEPEWKAIMETSVKKGIRQNTYPAWKVLRAMDLQGGVLNMEGIECLRQIESSGIKYYQNSILPSSAELKRIASRVERAGQFMIPYFFGRDNKNREYVKFDPEKLVPVVMEAYKMTEICRNRRAGISLAIDGAKISKNLSHVDLGIQDA